MISKKYYLVSIDFSHEKMLLNAFFLVYSTFSPDEMWLTLSLSWRDHEKVQTQFQITLIAMYKWWDETLSHLLFAFDQCTTSAHLHLPFISLDIKKIQWKAYWSPIECLIWHWNRPGFCLSSDANRIDIHSLSISQSIIEIAHWLG